MLKQQKVPYWQTTLFLCALVFFVFYGAYSCSSQPAAVPKVIDDSDQIACNKTCNDQPQESFLIRTWHDPVAFFTAMLTIFTGFLVWVAGRQVNLARDEYTSTHRPELIVRTVETVNDGDGLMRLIAEITVINRGATPARITALEGMIVTPAEELKPGIRLTLYPTPKTKLKTGKPYQWSIESDRYQEVAIQMAQSDPTGPPWFAIGAIHYMDANGGAHATGFCRRFDPSKRRWLREENSYYEYAWANIPHLTS
jgi:hypothetical protein